MNDQNRLPGDQTNLLSELSETDRQIMENPRAVIERILAEDASNLQLEKFQSKWQLRFTDKFKPVVDYIRSITGLRSVNPYLYKAVLCFELQQMEENPKLYAGIQRNELTFSASIDDQNLNSPVIQKLSTLSTQHFREFVGQVAEGKMPFDRFALMEKLIALRSPEELPDLIKMLSTYLAQICYYFSDRSQAPKGEFTARIESIINYFNRFTDHNLAAQVFADFQQKFPDRAKNISLIMLCLSTIKVELPGPVKGQVINYSSAIYLKDRFNNAIYALDPASISRLRGLVAAFLENSPYLNEAVNAARIQFITDFTRANLAEQIKFDQKYLEDLEYLEANLSEPEVTFSENGARLINSYRYTPLSELYIVEFPHLGNRLRLNDLSQALRGKSSDSVIDSKDAPPDLRSRVEALEERLTGYKAKIKNQIATQFEQHISQFLAEMRAAFEGNNVATLEKTKESIASLDKSISHLETSPNWQDADFPEQVEALKSAYIRAMFQLKTDLENSLIPKMLAEQEAKYRQVEIDYQSKVIEAKIEFLLGKYSLLTESNLKDVDVAVYASDSDEYEGDHTVDFRAAGQNRRITYEVGSNPELRRLKALTINLIIPHEIGHFLIDPAQQYINLKKKHFNDYDQARRGLNEESLKFFHKYLPESIVDGMGLKLVLDCGGTDSGPFQKEAAFISLSTALAALHRSMEIQYQLDPVQNLISSIRILAMIDFLIEEAEKLGKAEELFAGFYQSRKQFIASIEKYNHQSEANLSPEQIKNIKNLMKLAILHGMSLPYSNSENQ